MDFIVQYGEQPMSTADAIARRVKQMRKGQPFHRMVFAPLGSSAAVDTALSRLVQSGLLERLVRGVYMRPKISNLVGQRSATLLYARVLDRAIDVFGNQRLAEEWLGRPCRYLDGDVPQDVIDKPDRFQAVEDYLERIKHGVYQ